MTIAQRFGLEPVVIKNFSKAVPVDSAYPALIYGVELEIENVPNYDDCVVPGMSTVDDGSLRNFGREFITKPMTFSNLKYTLELFFNKNKFTQENYSDRTSIHVHTNCQDLEFEQVRNIALVYQLVERLLFLFVGADRDKNIFCVPWHQTMLTYQMFDKNVDPDKWRKWQKYTALNFLPLYSQGTIEWRHMPGTNDLNKIITWLQLISCIYAFTINKTTEYLENTICNLNTTSMYEGLLFQIFGNKAFELQVPGFTMLLEEGVLDVKYSMGAGKTPTVFKSKSLFLDNNEHLRRVLNEYRQNMQANQMQPDAPRRGGEIAAAGVVADLWLAEEPVRNN